MTSLFSIFNSFFSKRPLLLLVISLLVIALGAFSLRGLNLEEDITNVLPKDGELAKYEKLIEQSSTGNKLIFILKSEERDAEQLVQAGQSLQNLLETNIPDSLVESIDIVVDESQFLDLLNIVYSELPFYLNKDDLASLNFDEDKLREKIQKKLKILFTPAGSMMKESIIRDPLDLSLVALQNLQSLQIDDNFDNLNRSLISKDSTYLLGFVKLTGTVHLSGQKSLLLQAVKTSLEEANKQTNVQHFAFGASIIAEENAQRIKKDIMLTVNLALGILLLGLMLYFRSIKILPGFIIPIVLGASMALFVLFLQQDFISAISLGMGSVLLGTIIDYSLHIFTHLKQSGNDKETIKQTAGPILAGSITTSSAFLCLLFIGSKSLSDLAIFAALSMLFGAIFALIILPILYKNTFKVKSKQKATWLDDLMAKPFHQNKWILLVTSFTFLVSLFYIQRLDFTKDLNELNYMPPFIAQAETELNTASNALSGNLIAIIEEASLDDALRTTEIIEDQLKSQLPEGQITELKSATSVLSSKQKKKEKLDDWNQFWSEDKQDIVQKILFEEATKLGIKPSAFDSFISLMEGHLNTEETKEIGIADSYIAYSSSDKTYLSTLVIKLEASQKENVKAYLNTLDSDVNLIDRSSMVLNLIEQVKSSLDKISWLLLVLIILILGIYFRNLELVFLSFFPVFMSWLTTLGLMGFFNIPFNMLNIIIVIFIFGLGIDYAIFILNAMTNDYRTGQKTFSTVKSAVTLSAFTTFVGISVLVFAKHPALNSIAYAGMTAIVSVFVYAIVSLPALFSFLVNKRISRNFEPITIESLYDTFLSYSSLVFGVFMITFLGIVLRILFFVPINKRKLFFHKAFHFWANHYVRIVFPKGKRFFENESGEDFKKPAIIIANHQSLLDTPIMVSLNIKTILLTKDWVRNNPLFGIGSRLADFYSVDDGFEETVEKLKEKVKDNFSIALFPEGTRSKNRSLIRFHRGAFKLAEELKMDIVPVFIMGSIDTVHKDQLIGQRRELHLSIQERISFDNTKFRESSTSRYKLIRDYFKEKYYTKRKTVETGRYFHKQILSNYTYKGYTILHKAKAILKKFNDFEDLTTCFQNDLSTLIIDESYGLICIAQNLVNPQKEIAVLSSHVHIIQQCYLSSKSNSYFEEYSQVIGNFNQIIYIGEEALDKSNLEGLILDNTTVIELIL